MMNQDYELLRFKNRLIDKLLMGGGLRGLAADISAALKKEVVIANPSYRILVSTLSEEDMKEGTLLEISSLGQTSGRATVSLDDRRVEVLMINLINQFKKWGFLLICDPGPDEDNQIKILGQQAIAACVLELQKQEELIENKRQMRDAFLFDLLYGNLEEDTDIIAWGDIWGWNLRLPYVVTVFEPEDFEQYSGDFQLVNQILEIIQAVMHQLGRKVVLMQKKEEVILIISVDKQSRRENKRYLNMLINQIMAQITERLAPRAVRVGVGRDYANPTEIFRSYQEAKVALTLDRLLKDHNHTPFFTDLGVARILYNHDQQELQEFYRETLKDLERSSISQKNELMETLETYFFYHCDIKETANALFMHSNTLRYRLKKIEEILEVDLENFDTKLNIMIALKIKYLKKT